MCMAQIHGERVYMTGEMERVGIGSSGLLAGGDVSFSEHGAVLKISAALLETDVNVIWVSCWIFILSCCSSV